jgi:hypothetical protein
MKMELIAVLTFFFILEHLYWYIMPLYLTFVYKTHLLFTLWSKSLYKVYLIAF